MIQVLFFAVAALRVMRLVLRMQRDGKRLSFRILLAVLLFRVPIGRSSAKLLDIRTYRGVRIEWHFPPSMNAERVPQGRKKAGTEVPALSLLWRASATPPLYPFREIRQPTKIGLRCNVSGVMR